MTEINLLQNQLKDTTHSSSRRTLVVVWIALIMLLLALGACGYLYWQTSSVKTKTAELNTTNQGLQRQLSDQQKGLESAKIYQAKLTNLNVLLDNHISYSALFTELSKYTYIKAQYMNFDVKQATGKVHMEGNVDSYNGLAKLLLGLSTSAHFEKVKLLAIRPATTGTGFGFSVDMFALPDIFVTAK